MSDNIFNRFEESFLIVLVRDEESRNIMEHVCLDEEDFKHTCTEPDETIISIKSYPREGNEEFIERELVERNQ